MNVKNHLVDGVKFVESPNQGDIFAPGGADSIIMHYTAGSSVDSSVRTLTDPKSKASAHLVVGRDGSVTQLVPLNKIAWHAGRSSHGSRTGLNKYAIGIELDNAGRLTKSGDSFTSWFGRRYAREDVFEGTHRNERETGYWHRYTEEQIGAVFDVCSALCDSYAINAILGHEEIAPDRKIDPGPAFPLDKLRERILAGERAEEKPAQKGALPLGQGFVDAGRLNIRYSPSISAPQVVAPLERGTLVEILDAQAGWYQVAVERQGWVKADYIKGTLST